MERCEFNGKKEVNEFLEKNIRFTHEEGERVRARIREKKKNPLKFHPVYWTVLAAAASLFIILSFFLMEGSKNEILTGDPGISDSVNNEGAGTGITNSAYDGADLEIAIIGELPSSKFQNITFDAVNPESLVNNPKHYDAYFVTERYFEELATDEWTRTFKNMQVPVFFLGLDVQAFIFFEDNMDYNDQASPATSQVQGFVQVTDNGEETMKTWDIGDSASSTELADIADKTYIILFNEIEKFYKVQ